MTIYLNYFLDSTYKVLSLAILIMFEKYRTEFNGKCQRGFTEREVKIDHAFSLQKNIINT